MNAFVGLSIAGGSLSAELVADDELFVRWLGIAAFLPVISFQTPPWVFEKEWVSATRAGPQPHPGFSFHFSSFLVVVRKQRIRWSQVGHTVRKTEGSGSKTGRKMLTIES